jgi:geranylgeranyl diphosphate synthase type I
VAGTIPPAVAERYSQAVEDELKHWLSARGTVGQHYDMLAYHMGWVDAQMLPSGESGGKRFRPLLCLLSCDAVGGNYKDALPVAAAIELLHNFSLIHDDIEDHDASRRHRPTLWALWGEPLAINAGDAMLALSGMAALSVFHRPQIALKLQETALALTEGQYLDMSFENTVQVSIEDYRRMIQLKTATLIAYSCESGAQMGNGTDEEVSALHAFGENLGLAFQIYDDILGIWALASETGKAEAQDIANRKKSLPVLLAMSRATGVDRERLFAFYSQSAAISPEDVVRIVDATGVRADVQTRLLSHLSRAREALDSIPLRDPFRQELHQLARDLIDLSVLERAAAL